MAPRKKAVRAKKTPKKNLSPKNKKNLQNAKGMKGNTTRKNILQELTANTDIEAVFEERRITRAVARKLQAVGAVSRKTEVYSRQPLTNRRIYRVKKNLTVQQRNNPPIKEEVEELSSTRNDPSNIHVNITDVSPKPEEGTSSRKASLITEAEASTSLAHSEADEISVETEETTEMQITSHDSDEIMEYSDSTKPLNKGEDIAAVPEIENSRREIEQQTAIKNSLVVVPANSLIGNNATNIARQQTYVMDTIESPITSTDESVIFMDAIEASSENTNTSVSVYESPVNEIRVSATERTTGSGNTTYVISTASEISSRSSCEEMSTTSCEKVENTIDSSLFEGSSMEEEQPPARTRDNYNITLFEEYDPDNYLHRKGKQIAKWASDSDKIIEQAYLCRPDVCKYTTFKKNTGDRIFPPVDPKYKLFPNAVRRKQ